jgi:Clustered mitochondria/Translation initiation factor eIF3 subunit 135
MCAPLMALVDFLGYRLIAISLLPISGKTLIYGSDDIGEVVHSDRPAFTELMQSACEQLNLRPHLVRDRSGPAGATMSHYSAIDIEGHEGTDKRYYLLDFSRTFPPTTPEPGRFLNGHLYRLFRAEFCATHEQPLCPDSFTNFIAPDRARAEFNRHVRQATRKLFDQSVPELALALKRVLAQFKRLSDVASSGFNLSEWFHRYGVNIRYIGVVMRYLADADDLLILGVEAIARLLKNHLRLLLRNQTKELRMSLLGPAKLLVIDFFNRIFRPCGIGALGHDAIIAESFWERIVARDLSNFYYVRGSTLVRMIEHVDHRRQPHALVTIGADSSMSLGGAGQPSFTLGMAAGAAAMIHQPASRSTPPRPRGATTAIGGGAQSSSDSSFSDDSDDYDDDEQLVLVDADDSDAVGLALRSPYTHGAATATTRLGRSASMQQQPPPLPSSSSSSHGASLTRISKVLLLSIERCNAPVRYVLFKRLSDMMGLKWTPSAQERVKGRNPIVFDVMDLEDLRVMVKTTNWAAQAEGNYLFRKAMQSIENGASRDEVKRLFHLTKSKYESALVSTPNNASILMQCAQIWMKSLEWEYSSSSSSSSSQGATLQFPPDDRQVRQTASYFELSLNASKESSQRALCFSLFAQFLARCSESELAEDYFLSSLELEPSNVRFLCAYGSFLMEIGNRDDAMLMYDRARREQVAQLLPVTFGVPPPSASSTDVNVPPTLANLRRNSKPDRPGSIVVASERKDVPSRGRTESAMTQLRASMGVVSGALSSLSSDDDTSGGGGSGAVGLSPSGSVEDDYVAAGDGEGALRRRRETVRDMPLSSSSSATARSLSPGRQLADVGGIDLSRSEHVAMRSKTSIVGGLSMAFAEHQTSSPSSSISNDSELINRLMESDNIALVASQRVSRSNSASVNDAPRSGRRRSRSPSRHVSPTTLGQLRKTHVATTCATPESMPSATPPTAGSAGLLDADNVSLPSSRQGFRRSPRRVRSRSTAKGH